MGKRKDGVQRKQSNCLFCAYAGCFGVGNRVHRKGNKQEAESPQSLAGESAAGQVSNEGQMMIKKATNEAHKENEIQEPTKNKVKDCQMAEKSIPTTNQSENAAASSEDLTAEQAQLKKYHARDVQELTRIFVFIRLWKTRNETRNDTEFERIKATLSVEQCDYLVKQFCAL